MINVLSPRIMLERMVKLSETKMRERSRRTAVKILKKSSMEKIENRVGQYQ